MNKYPHPRLTFLTSAEAVGFVAAGISSFRDTGANVIVRELIQNSLDAAQEAQVSKAVVRFSTTQVKTKAIPGISSYRSAFKKAKKRREAKTGLSDQEKMVVDAISKALERDLQDVLVVTDNGVGLDEERMNALLADGAANKGKHAVGAFGVGHLSVLPLSDLRYVLYGGICNKQWIGSGHAILASHDEDQRDKIGRSANGYYLAGNDGREHLYLDKDELPPLIRKALSEIECSYEHGTAVIVPAFNRFKEKICLKDAVSEAAVCSFFPAVEEERLEVIVDDGDTSWTLNRGSLDEALGRCKQRKRVRGGYISGEKAYFSYNALVRGTCRDVDVLDGTVKIVVQHPASSGTMRVNLFRNGMWVTSDRGGIPRLHATLSNHEAFEALILVAAETAPEFHDLIRKAEGPSHNGLEPKHLTPEDRKQLNKAFDDVIEFFRNEIPIFSDEPYNPSDFLAFTDSTENPSGPRYGWDYRGIVTPIHRRISMQRSVGTNPGAGRSGGNGEASGGSGKNGQRDQSARRPALPSNFTAVVTPAGQDSKRIKIRCTETCDDLELRLIVDDRTDVTTDRIWPDRLAGIRSAKISGVPVPPERVVITPYPAIRLGRLEKGTTTEVMVEYALDGDAVPVLPDASLRIEIGAYRLNAEGGEQSE